MRPSPSGTPLARALPTLLLLAAVYGCDSAANPLGPTTGTEPTLERLEVFPGTDTLTALGSTLQLQAHLQGTDEPVVVRWNSSDSSVVAVDSAGRAVSVGNGRAVVHAEAQGQRDSAVVVVEQVAVGIVAEETGRTVAPGDTLRPRVYAVDPNGAALADADLRWSSLDPGVATVDSAGVARGVAAGVARLAIHMGALADTIPLPVLGTNDLLLTARADEDLRTSVRPGQTIDVPVTLDLSRLGDRGDLGSIQLDVTYDPALLHPQSSTPGVAGAAVTHHHEPGRIRFAFVATAAQDDPRLTLVTLTFRVADGAAAGSVADFGITYTGTPTDTSFGSYAVPVTLTGGVRVGAEGEGS